MVLGPDVCVSTVEFHVVLTAIGCVALLCFLQTANLQHIDVACL